jgi:histidinol-phosphate phosphatase family protein
LVLVTNQSAVGRGTITMGQAVEINQRAIATIESWGGRVDACYICPHHPEQCCDCRKPAPGMFLRAAREMGLDLSRSYSVGDAVSDLQAAQAAGARPILVLTGRGEQQVPLLEAQSLADCPVVTDLPAAVDLILEQRE